MAEDVALAQHLFASGKRTALILGHDELTTRMYTSLREIMAGWRKNVFAGGREAMPFGRLGQVIFPALLLLMPILTLAPPLVLAGAAVVGAPALAHASRRQSRSPRSSPRGRSCTAGWACRFATPCFSR